MPGKGLAVETTITATLSGLALGLVIAAIWRAAQFGMWMQAGWPGVLTLAVGQIGVFALPSAYFYLEVTKWMNPYGTGDAGLPLGLMVVLNIVAGVVPAFIQFSLLREFSVFLLNAGIPIAAAAMLAGALDQLGKLTRLRRGEAVQ